MKKFIISTNNFLKKNTEGYHHLYYTGYETKGNPDFLNILKNTYNEKPISTLISTREEVVTILLTDIPEIMKEKELKECSIVCVPRAKELKEYSNNQLFFQAAVSIAASKITGATDQSGSIIRTCNTKTTHLDVPDNDGDLPYPGITSATCCVNNIKDKDIILVDDIYTHSVNIDEDCIQFLLDKGAKSVIFYAIAFTDRSASNAS